MTDGETIRVFLGLVALMLGAGAVAGRGDW
jgi:hypothetical protein